MTNSSYRFPGAVAEYERPLIAERMRRGRQRQVLAGLLLPWARTPYGYRLSVTHPRDPAGVWVEVTEAIVVQEIFARYLRPDGTLRAVAKSLQAEGIATPRGHTRWDTSTLRGILTNPAYLGQVFAGRYRTRPARLRQSPLVPVGRRQSHPVLAPQQEWVRVATIPAVICQEQVDQVQAKLAQNQHRARRNNTAHDYLLRALVSCGLCKLACTGTDEDLGASLLPVSHQDLGSGVPHVPRALYSCSAARRSGLAGSG
jgi:site-specific DNA recombinase